MTYELLLLTGAEPGPNLTHLRSAMEALGRVSIVAPDSFDPEVHALGHILIIVDASYVTHLEETVSDIHRVVPSAKIVVITASPTWQRARAAFEAGASDYLSKNMPTQELRLALEHVLHRDAVRGGRRK